MAPRRRKRRGSALGPRAGSPFLASSAPRRRRRRHSRGTTLGGGGGRGPSRRRLPVVPLLALLLLLAVGGGAAYGVRAYLERDEGTDARQAAAQRFATAWGARDTAAMWRALTPASRARTTRAELVSAYRSSDRAAEVSSVRIVRVGALADGHVPVRVAVRTASFGTLGGVVRLPVVNGAAKDGSQAGVTWGPSLRLPGLRPGEQVRRVLGARPARANVLGADGKVLSLDIVGRAPSGDDAGSGLQRQYDGRLGGRRAKALRFGRRVVARVAARRPRAVRTTIRPGLQAAAARALGNKLGGVAVIRPRDGAIQALAGLAVSAPQPPGSTFKVITTAAALANGLASPGSTYPVRTFATLSGRRLRNASDESCGGTLREALAESCNSVFAPLGARLGARRLVSMAERFGFNERPDVPAAKASTIPAAAQLKDSLAVGASAIGQDRDLATPLQMASVAATIAARGRRARPRLVDGITVVRRRVVSARVAAQVRDMMLGVVRTGTGRAAAIPGVSIAGKTGTAELRPTADGTPDPKNTDAWFIAFAPSGSPSVAVAVMLVGAGQGGASAAPVARAVLRAALAG